MGDCDRFTLVCAAAMAASFGCPDSVMIQSQESLDCLPNSHVWCPAISGRWNFADAGPICAGAALRFHRNRQFRRLHRGRSPWIRRHSVAVRRSHPLGRISLMFGISLYIFGGNTSSIRDTEHHPSAKFSGRKNHIVSFVGNACARNRVDVTHSHQLCRPHPNVRCLKRAYRKWCGKKEKTIIRRVLMSFESGVLRGQIKLFSTPVKEEENLQTVESSLARRPLARHGNIRHT